MTGTNPQITARLAIIQLDVLVQKQISMTTPILR